MLLRTTYLLFSENKPPLTYKHNKSHYFLKLAVKVTTHKFIFLFCYNILSLGDNSYYNRIVWNFSLYK